MVKAQRSKQSLESLHTGISSDWIDLIKACLEFNPSDRPQVDSIINLPMFDRIRDQESVNLAVTEEPLFICVDHMKIR